MDSPQISSENYLHNSTECSNISLIRPDSETTLYLEDDNNSFGIEDIHLGNDIQLGLPKLETESKQHWSGYKNFNLDIDDEVVDVLKPEQIRWFYKNIANKQWVEFNGYDSLRIEKRLNNLTEKEWKFYTATSRPKRSQEKSPYTSPTLEYLKNPGNLTENDNVSYENVSPSSETVDKVVVRGGLYEVDLLKRSCSSIFWPSKLKCMLI